MKKIVINAPQFYGIDEAIQEAFIQLGFEAVLKNYRTKATIQETIARRLAIKYTFTKPVFMPLIRHYLAKDNREFMSMLRREKPDLLFIIKGDHLFPHTLEAFKNETSTPVVAYIWDDPFYSYAGLYADAYRKTNFEKGMHLYDYIFVYDTYYVEEIKKRGVTNVEYLPLASDPKRYNPIKLSETDRKNYDYDVCFVGVPYPNRVEVLDSIANYKIGVFGDGWTKYFLRRGKKIPAYYKGKATGEKVIKIYRASKIVLNIHDPEAREGVNTRTFDILACGARELVDYKKSLETHFKVGEEIAVYRNIEELKKLGDIYLHDTDLIDQISQRGRQRVLKEHTWVHRMSKVIDSLKDHQIFSQ